MQNKNYEFLRKSRKGKVEILKITENLSELVLLKRRYKNNSRNTYEIRPEVVRISLNNEVTPAHIKPL